MKHFDLISIGELKKYNGFKCKAKVYYGIIIEGEIFIANGYICILHNNSEASGIKPKNLKGYKYAWYICDNSDDDNKIIPNGSYKWIEII